MVVRNARLALACLVTCVSLACGGSSPTASSSSESAREEALTSATASFAVLANQAATCTNGVIAGNVGTNQATPTGSFTATSCPVSGAVDVGGPSAQDAYKEFLTAYGVLAPQPGDGCTVLSGTLSGVTLAPGTYCFPAAAVLTGRLTLDGPPNAAWVFKIGSGTPATGALTGSSLAVVMSGGAQACNVTWWVAQAVTMTDSNLAGNVLAGAAITFTRGTSTGDAFSKADVTITGTAVTACGSGSAGGGGGGGGDGGTGGGTCKAKDFVTGGGFIGAPSGAKANFAVAGGAKHGKLWGHLSYEDRGRNGTKVQGTGVTNYLVIDATTRRIQGTANVNGRGGFTYQVDVSDKGEWGRNDTFAILLSNGYSASGKLGGGNLQLHEGRACKDHGDGDDDDDGDDEGGGGDDDHDEGHGKGGGR